MKVPPKRTIMPTGKHIAARRIPTASEQQDSNMGATERDVQPLTPPAAQMPANPAQPALSLTALDPRDELTPG